MILNRFEDIRHEYLATQLDQLDIKYVYKPGFFINTVSENGTLFLPNGDLPGIFMPEDMLMTDFYIPEFQTVVRFMRFIDYYQTRFKRLKKRFETDGYHFISIPPETEDAGNPNNYKTMCREAYMDYILNLVKGFSSRKMEEIEGKIKTLDKLLRHK